MKDLMILFFSGILPLVLVIFMLVIGWRIMIATERIADMLENKQPKETK